MTKAAKLPPDIPASAVAAKLLLDARNVANLLVEECFAAAARHDKVDKMHYGYVNTEGVWRHVSRLRPAGPEVPK